jgi:hypothetical protein
MSEALETLSPLPEGAGSDTVGGSPKDNIPSESLGTRQSPADAVNEVNTFYNRARQERRPYEERWFYNAAIVRGSQNLKWNQLTARLESKRVPSHRENRSINLVLPKVRAKLAKFVKTRPLPQVLPAKTDRQSVLDAKATEKVLQFAWRKLGLEPKYEDAILWCMITGKSYWWFHWNPKALATVKDPDSGQHMDVPLGDILIELGTAFEVFPDDVGVTRLQDQPRILRVKIRDVAEIETRYELPPGSVKAEMSAQDVFQFQKQIASLGSRLVTGLMNDDKTAEGVPTKIAVKEVFWRPCALYPKGRYTVVAGDTLLKDDYELPYDFGSDVANPYPVVEFSDMIVPGQFWPTTMVEQLTPLQQEYNNARNRLAEQMKLQSHPKLIAPKQANLAPNAYNSEAGEKIEYHFIPGMPQPGFLQPPSIAADTWRLFQLVKSEMDDVSNIRPADVGNVNDGGESGFQTNLLQEASDSVHAPDIRRNELAIEEASFKMRRMMAMGYTVPRLIAIVGRNHAPDVFEFSQDNIDEHAEVVVQVGSALPTLKAARSKMIMEMHTAMLFGDPNDPTVKRKVLGMLEVGGVEDATDQLRRDEEMARQENLEVSKGNPIDPPMPWENHQVQYAEHTDQLKSPEIKDWTPEQRDELIRHVILHARFINPQNAMMLAQQFGYDDLIQIIQPMLAPPTPPAGPPPGAPSSPPPSPPGAPAPGGPPPPPPPPQLHPELHSALRDIHQQHQQQQ